MAYVEAITDDAGLERAEARLSSMMGKTPKDDSEAAELSALAKEVERYCWTRFEVLRTPTDGVHELTFMLDQQMATLEELIPIFGGRERLIEYVTREVNIDEATMDAIASTFNRKRERFDKPFCEPPGMQALIMEETEPCLDPEMCPPEGPDWRAELTGMGRIEAGLGVGNPAHPVHPC